jgi:hypothetical protein
LIIIKQENNLTKLKNVSDSHEEEEEAEEVEHKLVEEPVLLSESNEGEVDDEEGFVVKRMPWTLQIEGLDMMIPLSAMKLPMLSVGSADGGDMLVETLNVPGNTLNFYLNSWLRSPHYKKIIVNVLDPIGIPLEVWKMEAKPSVMGFSPLNIQDDSPWVTQVVFVTRDIRIEPPEVSNPGQAAS